MKVINEEAGANLDQILYKASILPGIGTLAATVRVVWGAVQVIFNALLLIPSAIATGCGLNKHHWLHISTIGADLGEGLVNIVWGALFESWWLPSLIVGSHEGK
ncbi:MAG: hypothetical protein ACHQT8_00635 [Chlamydiales bacterium]